MGDYDEDTAFLGQTGPYFWSTFFLLNTVFIPTGFNGLYIVFVGASPQHHCLVPDLNLSAVWADAVIPVVGEDSSGAQVRSQCSRYQLEVVKNLSDRGLLPGRDVNLSSLEQEACLDGWSFSKEIYQSNIVTEVSGPRHPGTIVQHAGNLLHSSQNPFRVLLTSPSYLGQVEKIMSDAFK